MITRGSLLKVFMGSFFIQSSWNFDKLQGLGFAAAISPALRDIFDDGEDRERAFKRHLTLFNSHPYMASPILGATVRLEEGCSKGDCGPESPAGFKRKIMGAYGAIGDSFFWCSVRPLASVLGVVATLILGLWGPVVFLLLYNSVHVWMRWRGLERGYALGEGVARYIKGLGLPEWGARARYGLAASLGVLAAVAVWLSSTAGLVRSQSYWPVAFAAAVAAASSLVGTLMARGVKVAWLVYAIVLPLVGLGLVGLFQ